MATKNNISIIFWSNVENLSGGRVLTLSGHQKILDILLFLADLNGSSVKSSQRIFGRHKDFKTYRLGMAEWKGPPSAMVLSRLTLTITYSIRQLMILTTEKLFNAHILNFDLSMCNPFVLSSFIAFTSIKKTSFYSCQIYQMWFSRLQNKNAML